MGMNNIELITDRPLQVNLDEIKQVKRDWPDRAVVVSLMVPCDEESWKRILPLVEETGRGWHRAEFRLPAWHERARHGLGRGAGAGLCRDGHALVQAAYPHAGDREAHAQYHGYSAARAARRGAAARMR